MPTTAPCGLAPTGSTRPSPLTSSSAPSATSACPWPEVPFDERRGVIPNDRGRVLAGEGQEPVVGFYASGWIKRGPSGVIGTNKPDAAETVERMLEDLQSGAVVDPARADVAAAERLVRERQPDYVSYEDWLRLDDLETARGKESGRPRVKLTRTEDMIAALKMPASPTPSG